eukprot:jgi/Orpsp1_1/1175171/evm.model.c7180000052863.1
MKLQNNLFIFLLILQLVTALAIKTSDRYSKNDIENKKIFNYNFYCVEDNEKMCSKLHRKVNEATNSLSTILDMSSKVNFDVFVDNLSKYRIDKSKDVLAVAIDNKFNPLISNNTNIISPYPNSKALKMKLNLKKNNDIMKRDFILLLNNFKSNKNYLNKLQDEKYLILLEIFEGLYNLDKLPYPYNEKKEENKVTSINDLVNANVLLKVRKNETFIDDFALSNDKSFKKFIDSNKLPEIIRWEDTLISKGIKNFPKLKYKYKRTVAIGDVHGDFKKFESVLRHAKLIDKNDNWIATDTILVQNGDLTDRGPDFKQIIDLLIKLRAQARKRGGIVYMMLGNHELYDMQAGYFVLSKSDIDAFGGVAEREKAYLWKETTAPSFDDLLENYYSQNKTHPLYTDPAFDLNGPLWNQYYINTPEEESCKELDKVLKITKTKRMIIGHTIQEYGHINTKCQNKLILIDVALSKCLGNYFGYVEILNHKKEIWARYLN